MTRREWDLHCSETVRPMQIRDAELEHRIDQLEAKWDRYAGPAVFTLIVIGAIGALASVYNAFIV